MDTQSYKTVSLNKKTVEKKWILIDAEGQPLGRLSSIAAKFIRGKYKPGYTPHVDCGDNVIIINAEKVSLSGNKINDKKYIHYTGYPGGQRVKTATEVQSKFPERLVENAVRGMLPKNKLGRALFNNLHVFVGSEHDKAAQKPETINLNEVK